MSPDQFHSALSVILLSALGGIFAAVAGWSLYRRFKKFSGGFRSWKAVVQNVADVAQEMKSDGFEPSVILGLGKGGVILAALLGGHFTGAAIVALKRRGAPNGLPFAVKAVYAGAIHNGKPPTFLLVSDKVYEGTSFRECSGHLQALGEVIIRTFAYSAPPRAEHGVHYKITETKKRLKFPWSESDRSRGNNDN